MTSAQQELQYEVLLKAVLNQAIDESLRAKPSNGCGITHKTIQEARRYIKSQFLFDRYKELYNIYPYVLVRKLRLMWYDLMTYPSTAEKNSVTYRRIFNAANGGEAKRKQMGKWRLDYEVS